MPRKLEVEIVGDAGSFERALGRADASGSKLGRTFGGMAKATALAGAALGGLAAVGAAKAIDAANDLGESINAVNVTFGEGADAIHAFSEDAAKKAGLSMRAFNQAVVPIGASLRNVGFGAKDAAKASIDLASRAADMASVFNTDVSEALLAIQAGLRGEADPLERFGVGLNAAAIESFALTKGLAKTKAEITDQIKVQARMGLLMQQSARFAGDFANTSDGLANSQRVLKAELENAAASIGQALLPAATKAVSVLADLVPVVTEFGGKIAGAIGPAVEGLVDSFKSALPAIMGVLEPLAEMVRTNIVPVLEALGRIGSEAIERISAIIKANGPQLREIFKNLGEVISNLAKVVVPLLEFAFTKVLPAAIAVLIPVLRVVTEVLAAVSKVVGVVAGAINAVLIPAMSALLSIGGKVAKFLSDVLVSAFESIDGPVKAVAGVLKSILVPAFNAVTSAMDAVRDLFGWFAEKASPIWQKLARIIPPAVAAITAPFQHLGDVLTAIIGLFKAFIDKAGEVIDLASKVAGAVGGVIGKIPGLQHGGVARQGQAYVVGESGPELFVPGLTGTVIPNFMEPRQVGLPGGGGVGGGGSTFILNFNGPAVGTSRDFQDLVRRAFYDVQRLNPGTGIA